MKNEYKYLQFIVACVFLLGGFSARAGSSQVEYDPALLSTIADANRKLDRDRIFIDGESLSSVTTEKSLGATIVGGGAQTQITLTGQNLYTRLYQIEKLSAGDSAKGCVSTFLDGAVYNHYINRGYILASAVETEYNWYRNNAGMRRMSYATTFVHALNPEIYKPETVISAPDCWIKISPNKAAAKKTALIEDIQDASFDSKILSRRPVTLVMLTAKWCAICKEVTPAIQKEVQDHSADVQLLLIHGDSVADGSTDVTAQLRNRFRTQLFPTLVVLRGEEIVARMTGGQIKDHVQKLVQFGMDPEMDSKSLEFPLFPIWE